MKYPNNYWLRWFSSGFILGTIALWVLIAKGDVKDFSIQLFNMRPITEQHVAIPLACVITGMFLGCFSLAVAALRNYSHHRAN